jgi:probable HAF family extracellular repeat protein
VKKNILAHATTISLFALLATVQLFAQQPRYKLVDLGTFGGSQSYVNFGSGLFFGQHIAAVNRKGAVVGFADTSAPDPFQDFCFWDCSVARAFLSDSSGKLTNLGALPGGGSSAPNWITANGFIAGESENGETDPLYSGLPQMRAVVWFDDHIFDLGTLGGGYQSEANAVNRFGQVVGAALNTVPDNNSMEVNVFWLWASISPVYPYQTRAFIWDQENGMQDLGTLGEGTDAQALLINDRGQVAGVSYINSTPSASCPYPLATRSFIWEKQTGMVDLGSFGGTCTAVADLNQRGQIVGESNLKGDATSEAFLWDGTIHHLGGSLGGDFTGAGAVNEAGQAVGFGYLAGNATFHATLWKQPGEITDLGVLGNDQCSGAADINSRGQVVGSSIPNCSGDPTTFRAFLWQNDTIFDLNTLIPPGSPLYLQYVQTINDRGEIAGEGMDSSGNEHAFLLVPCDQNGSDCESLRDGISTAPARPAEATQLRPSTGSRAVQFMLRSER